MSATAGPSTEDSRAEFRFPLPALAVASGVAGLMDALAMIRYGVMKTATCVAAWITGSGTARRQASQGVMLGLLGIGGYVSGSFFGALTGSRPTTFALAAAVLVALMLTLRSLQLRFLRRRR